MSVCIYSSLDVVLRIQLFHAHYNYCYWHKLGFWSYFIERARVDYLRDKRIYTYDILAAELNDLSATQRVLRQSKSALKAHCKQPAIVNDQSTALNLAKLSFYYTKMKAFNGWRDACPTDVWSSPLVRYIWMPSDACSSDYEVRSMHQVNPLLNFYYNNHSTIEKGDFLVFQGNYIATRLYKAALFRRANFTGENATHHIHLLFDFWNGLISLHMVSNVMTFSQFFIYFIDDFMPVFSVRYRCLKCHSRKPDVCCCSCAPPRNIWKLSYFVSWRRLDWSWLIDCPDGFRFASV
jgi:hypothetical protein